LELRGASSPLDLIDELEMQIEQAAHEAEHQP